LATASIRSKPAPVSIALRGRSRELAVGGAIELLEDDVPDLDEAVAAIGPGIVGSARVLGPVSKKISVHGPHGPVGPIVQKLSSSQREIRAGSSPISFSHSAALRRRRYGP
jgi:hypothetical protein